ncbi:uncharacterized protein SCHCODRAFT_02482729 [Schizophyllum commune H4-8]|nr:uncharacterized protein SCHCODRAFT_02482729 [Schizophyllum commune H4-8]KAI5900743.1 hypothetical protein SCHCODRAFT_02482729 [Schizophyllum commune H4-8]
MTAYEHYRDEFLCPITGATSDVYECPLIPYDASDASPMTVACQEWIFGLKRGGLPYYLHSPENHIVFRKDIGEMLREGAFVLVPTYRTYLDVMHFIESAAQKGRNNRPRRPLSALAPASGLYRYVFIPLTEAARALQDEFHLKPQTKEDLNGGISPVHNKPYLPGSDQFRVIECLTHPFSVCSWAFAMLYRCSTPLTSQWHVLCGRIVRQWQHERIKPPTWFFEAPKYTQDDEALTPSEATGYVIPDHRPRKHDPVEILKNAAIEEDNYCKKCAKWTLDVPPDAPPPEEDPPYSVYRERRSVRIAKRAHPYYRPPKSPSAEEDCSGPLPSPTRKGQRALQTCKRDPIKNPPSWAVRNGKYPTQTFCSNDWAYFKYNVYLASFDDR